MDDILIFSATAEDHEGHLTLDKELLCVVEAFSTWRALLLSAQCEILVLTDHTNLEDFTRPVRETRHVNYFGGWIFSPAQLCHRTHTGQRIGP